MNLPKIFPKLDTLLDKMITTFRPFKKMVDIQLDGPGILVPQNEFDIIDETIPIVHKRKAVFYIWDTITYRKNAETYGWKNKEPRYHVVNCKTLQEMQERNRFGQYQASARTDGSFPVKSSNEEPDTLELIVCRYCLKQLNEIYGVNLFPSEPENFPLADWFEAFDVNENLEEIEGLDVKFDYSSESWKKRSLECREKANWTCQECSVNLKKDHYLLHAHHQWGTQFNNLQDLIALCIRCHAEQPGHGHRLLKYRASYLEFERKYGKDLPSNQSLNLQVSQIRENSSNSSDNYLISDYTEEDDIPF